MADFCTCDAPNCMTDVTNSDAVLLQSDLVRNVWIFSLTMQ